MSIVFKLMVQDVDVLDPRMKEVRCKFWTDAYSEGREGTICEIVIQDPPKFHLSAFMSFRNVHLMEGDVTAHTGKQQPVPDNVVLKCELKDGSKAIKLAQYFDWETNHVVSYQVQGQQPESHGDRCRCDECR